MFRKMGLAERLLREILRHLKSSFCYHFDNILNRRIVSNHLIVSNALVNKHILYPILLSCFGTFRGGCFPQVRSGTL